MIKAHLDDRKAVPMWAAIGAPLVGVPLMVLLLAVTAPTQTRSVDHEAAVRTEQVDVQGVERPVDAEEVDQPFRRG